MRDVAERAALDDAAVLLPECEQRSWYPGRFFDPVDGNEPHLTRAVEAVQQVVDVARAAGIPAGRIVLAGFSQGACVVTELLRRDPRPFGAVVVLTGALMGAPREDGEHPRPAGDLAGVRMHFSCSRRDAWIPLEHAVAARRYFERAGARVTMSVSDETEHHVSDAEAAYLRRLVDEVVAGDR